MYHSLWNNAGWWSWYLLQLSRRKLQLPAAFSLLFALYHNHENRKIARLDGAPKMVTFVFHSWSSASPQCVFTILGIQGCPIGQAKGLAAPAPLRRHGGNHRARHEYVIAIHVVLFHTARFSPHTPIAEKGKRLRRVLWEPLFSFFFCYLIDY